MHLERVAALADGTEIPVPGCHTLRDAWTLHSIHCCSDLHSGSKDRIFTGLLWTPGT